MGRKNSKIPGQRMEIQKGLQKEVKQRRKPSTVGSRMKGQKRQQEKVKQYNGLLAEDKKKLKNTALQHYEEYINSNAKKKKQIILQILKDCELVDDPGNRHLIIRSISNENQKRERDENEISKEEQERLKNTILNRYEEYINSNAKKKKQIILQILKECGLVYNPGNRYWIINFIKNEKQKRERDENKISKEEQERLKNTTLNRYEEYINSNAKKKKQIILQILKDCELVDNPGNRYWIINFIKNEKQKRERYKISAEDKEKLKNTALQHYEEYINSDREKKEQIILQILAECRLGDNKSNRRWIAIYISNENQKRKNEKEKTLVPTEKPKHRNKLSLLVLKEINSFIIKNDLHTKYLEAENNRGKKIDIINTILNECKIEDYPKNRVMIKRLILQQTFKPWSDEEEKALEELLCNKINMAVRKELGDNKKIMQVRKQIMNEFKKQFPVSEHNEADIMHKMSLLACHIKYTTQKPIEAEQTKPVQQAISKVIGKELQLNKVDEELCNQLLEELSDFGIDIDMFENHENCPEF